MKKKRIVWFSSSGKSSQTSKIMKLIILFMTLGCLSLSAESVAQHQKVTLNLKNCTLMELFEEIQEQTDLYFFYDENHFKNRTGLNVKAEDETVKDLLKRVFREEKVEFLFEDGTVIVRPLREREPEAKVVKGVVKDKQGLPLPGVAVVVKGTPLGTATDVDGKYTLTLPNGEYTLVFSMLGMDTREEVIGKRTEINVVLKEAVTEMDEVVVTGIFKKARESYTGAVSTITSKDLRMHRGQNLLQTLKNADASLNFAVNNLAGSNPNTLPQLNIRGNSSLPMSVSEFNESASNAVNTPLIIVDGFEISLEKLMDYNDEEIESINILKDAAATAIYGSRGSNGVIVIITRQPEAGKLRLSAEIGMDLEVPDLTSYDLLDARKKLTLEKQVGLYDSSNPERDLLYKSIYNKRLKRALSGETTDWINKPIRTGIGARYSLRLEGGSEQFRWSVTTNYKDTQGAMKNSSRGTFNGSITLMYSVKNLIFKNYTSYGKSSGDESNYGSFSDYVALQPYNSPYDEQGNVVGFFENFYGLEKGTKEPNPLYDASLNTLNKSAYEELTENFSIEWNVLEGLTLRGQFGITNTSTSSDYFLPAEHSYFTTGSNASIYSSDEGFFRRGLYRYSVGKNYRYSGNLTLSYSQTFMDKHQLYVGLDYSIAADQQSSYRFTLEGFSDENMDFLGNARGYEKDGMPSGTKGRSRRLGLTGNVNYTYDGRYYVDLSARMDGSSTFGSDKKYAPFWSVGVGWNLHRENFLTGNSWLNTLRLKASYGQTGSQQGSGSGASTIYAYDSNNKYMNWTGSILREWGNPRLTWQMTDELNVGTEFGLWEGRVRVEFDFYTKKTSNLLSSMDLPLSMGLPSYIANVGEVKNRGWEASLNFYIIRDHERQINWMVSGQLVYDKNWISKLSDAVKAQNEEYLAQNVEVSSLFYEGRPQNAIYAVRSLGIDPGTGKEMLLDRNGNITDVWKAGDKVYLGSSDPLYRGNLNTMVMWKGLTFNLSFGYSWGGMVYNQTLVDRVEVTRNALTSSNVDTRVYNARWQKPGDVSFFKGFSDEATRATSRFVMKDNVLKLQSLNLQYRWDSKWLRKQMRVQTVTLGVNVSDLFYWSSTRLERGIDYPFARNIQGSLKFLF